jgi:hypothetical protein
VRRVRRRLAGSALRERRVTANPLLRRAARAPGAPSERGRRPDGLELIGG